MVDAQGNVIVVCPPQCRKEMLVGRENVRVESDDGQEWEVPDEFDMGVLQRYLEDYAFKPIWRASVDPPVRIGFNKTGVYIHREHRKRFFGVVRESASAMLQREAPEPVPVFEPEAAPTAAAQVGGGRSTGHFMNALVKGVEKISDELRNQIMLASFRAADQNANGTLSRPEVGSLMRKLVYTIKFSEVEAMMKVADVDKDNQISYAEFVKWLPTHAPETVRKAIASSLNTNQDVLKAVFRVWDKNGDGSISATELRRVLQSAIPNFSTRQVNVLIDVMDKDDDNAIDYQEFVDFLFAA